MPRFLRLQTSNVGCLLVYRWRGAFFKVSWPRFRLRSTECAYAGRPPACLPQQRALGLVGEAHKNGKNLLLRNFSTAVRNEKIAYFIFLYFVCCAAFLCVIFAMHHFATIISVFDRRVLPRGSDGTLCTIKMSDGYEVKVATAIANAQKRRQNKTKKTGRGDYFEACGRRRRRRRRRRRQQEGGYDEQSRHSKISVSCEGGGARAECFFSTLSAHVFIKNKKMICRR